jgi:ubiquinone/menaquinone biosynthesis C-methylase UbiE
MSKRKEGQNKSMTTLAQSHLDAAGVSYLKAINGADGAHLAKYMRELEILTNMLGNEPVVVSVGVGNGVEVMALQQLLKDKSARVIGVDLSDSAISYTRKQIEKFNLSNVDLLQASGIELPLVDKSVDGYVLSAILHEIFSYVPNGLVALKRGIVEAIRVIKPGGYLYIKDFATVNNPNSLATIELKTNFARNFYYLFTKHYRKFESWGEDGVKQMTGDIDLSFVFPSPEDNRVTIPAGWASEFLMHLRNAFNDVLDGSLRLDDDGITNWKEINEQYYPSVSKKVLSPQDFGDLIITTAQQAFPDRMFEIEALNLVTRPSNNDEIGIHVHVEGHSIEDLTRKLFVFAKIR